MGYSHIYNLYGDLLLDRSRFLLDCFLQEGSVIWTDSSLEHGHAFGLILNLKMEGNNLEMSLLMQCSIVR
jgi:hypothetical protein